MAKLDQIELPNGVTYDFDDKYARKLTNNDFDTINVTELNAGDLIVTGVGRFTNGLYGNLIGNADTATSAIKATQDESGNNIKSTYANGISINDHTITLKNKNGISLGTVTVPDNNTTYTVATGTAKGKIKVTPSSGDAYEVPVYGLKSAAYKNVTDTYSETGTDPVSGKAVKSAIDGLPSPMVFRGTVGIGGTITNVPTDGTAVVGDTYKVITNGVYGGKSAKVGDTLICLTKTSTANTWELVPSGDEPSGTVTSVAVANGGGLSVSGSPITSSGTITISHADTSSQASVNNSGRTYIQDITLDTYGHVTGIASATETVVNTDRYVNSAAFADATSADANNPVKMTLTRAGSDTASVTAYIPKVSSSSAGVVPKGAAVSSQSQTTKFLREDGTWAAPSYTTDTNTTYSLSASGESVVLSGSDNTSTTADLSTAFANYMPKAGGIFTGRVAYKNVSMPISAGKITNLATGTTEIFKDGIAISNPATANDVGWIRVLGTGESDTVLEIATGDDGGGSTAEKIVVRQYNTSSAIAKEAVLLAPNGTTSFPVSVTAPKFIGTLEGTAYEANLAWGGKNFTGNYGCLDACLMDELGANRLQFIKASALTVEYSRDGGSTWTDYGATDAQKQQIFAQGGGLAIGKADSTNKATEHPGEYQLRITINTGAANVYTYLNKFVIYVSTNGSANCVCKIQKAFQSTPTEFVDHTDWVGITGWSGYNVINCSAFPTYGNTASSQYGRVRFIFKDGTGGNTNYPGLSIIQIKGFGGVGWGTPSTMAKTGHLYAYDEAQNAVFPGNVSVGTQVTTTAPSSATSVNRITIIPYYHTGGPWYIASKDDSSNAYITFRYGNNEVASIKHTGLITANGFSGPLTGNVTGNCSGSAGSVAWGNVTGKPNTYPPEAHGHGLLHSDFTTTVANTTEDSGWSMINSTYNGFLLKSIRFNQNAPSWSVGNFGAGICFGGSDTKGVMSVAYGSPSIKIAGGNQTKPQWWIGLTGTTGTTYNLSNFVTSDTKNTAGSTDTSSKIFLIGATSQAANPQTYSDNEVYTTSGVLTTKSVQVGGGSATMEYSATTKSINFVFAS